MANPVCWFEIQGENQGKLREYYSNLFGWNINADNPIDYGIVREEQGGIGGGFAAGPKAVLVYVAVDNLEEALEKAAALGGKVVKPITHVPGMVTYAHIEDPAGNVMGLVYNDPAAK